MGSKSGPQEAVSVLAPLNSAVKGLMTYGEALGSRTGIPWLIACSGLSCCRDGCLQIFALPAHTVGLLLDSGCSAWGKISLLPLCSDMAT